MQKRKGVKDAYALTLKALATLEVRCLYKGFEVFSPLVAAFCSSAGCFRQICGCSFVIFVASRHSSFLISASGLGEHSSHNPFALPGSACHTLSLQFGYKYGVTSDVSVMGMDTAWQGVGSLLDEQFSACCHLLELKCITGG